MPIFDYPEAFQDLSDDHQFFPSVNFAPRYLLWESQEFGDILRTGRDTAVPPLVHEKRQIVRPRHRPHEFDTFVGFPIVEVKRQVWELRQVGTSEKENRPGSLVPSRILWPSSRVARPSAKNL